ncbi:MAG: DUF6580 family putative transport protein, partial [Planctomycetota bacterium]
AGYHVRGRWAWALPVAAVGLSDVVGHFCNLPGMGFYNPLAMACVYSGFIAAVGIGWVSKRVSKDQPSLGKGLSVLGGSLAASLAFFLISNFGVWLAGWYPMNAAGLLQCYFNAIPFFRNALIGDLSFALVLFGSMAMANAWSARKQSSIQTA